MRQFGKGSVAEGGLDVFAELLNMLILSMKSDYCIPQEATWDRGLEWATSSNMQDRIEIQRRGKQSWKVDRKSWENKIKENVRCNLGSKAFKLQLKENQTDLRISPFLFKLKNDFYHAKV